MQSMRLSGPEDSRLRVESNIQPLLISSVESISRNLTMAQLAASEMNFFFFNFRRSINELATTYSGDPL